MLPEKIHLNDIWGDDERIEYLKTLSSQAITLKSNNNGYLKDTTLLNLKGDHYLKIRRTQFDKKDLDKPTIICNSLVYGETKISKKLIKDVAYYSEVEKGDVYTKVYLILSKNKVDKYYEIVTLKNVEINDIIYLLNWLLWINHIKKREVISLDTEPLERDTTASYCISNNEVVKESNKGGVILYGTKNKPSTIDNVFEWFIH